MPQDTRPKPLEPMVLLQAIAASFLVGIAISLPCAILLSLLMGRSTDLANVLDSSIVLSVLALLVSMVPYPVAGYVAARQAGHSKFMHVLVTGVVLLLLSAACDLGAWYWSLSSPGWRDGWRDVAYLLMILPFTLLGGRMGLKAA